MHRVRCTAEGGSTFKDVLTQHFRLKRPELLQQCDAWMAMINTSATRGGPAPERHGKNTLVRAGCGVAATDDGWLGLG
jgi:hypothetical protein